MPPKIGRCPTKIGTHPHKQKKFQNMAVGASRCCREVALIVDRLQPRWRWTRTTPRWKGRRGLWTALPVALTDKELLRDNSENTDNFAQATMFNAITTLHTTRQVQQHRPVDFTQAHASTTSPAVKVHQLHIYNNRQQHSMRQRHTCVFWLISPKSVGLAFIVYSHFTLYRHNKLYWLLRYDTI